MYLRAYDNFLYLILFHDFAILGVNIMLYALFVGGFQGVRGGLWDF